MSDKESIHELTGYWGPMEALAQVRAQSGASLREAFNAMRDARGDQEEALRLLREGRSQEWLDNRRVEIAKEREYEELHKESLQERFDEEMYYANLRTIGLKEELDSLGY